MAKQAGKAQTGPLAIIGGGNIGTGIARGLVASGGYEPGNIIVTRRNVALLAGLAEQGFQVQSDNEGAVDAAGAVIIAVQTVYKLLRSMNLAPHFVTSLDFHEISEDFFLGFDDP
ncbi:MAG: NAD(P)-binding domain-containing protein, partial [Candidatus Marinimicrobia bacterium]|nr:NAD(P)-binding domain-containing protein [Candidatus Neomarinimicrobiota bacterium]